MNIFFKKIQKRNFIGFKIDVTVTFAIIQKSTFATLKKSHICTIAI